MAGVHPQAASFSAAQQQQNKADQLAEDGGKSRAFYLKAQHKDEQWVQQGIERRP